MAVAKTPVMDGSYDLGIVPVAGRIDPATPATGIAELVIALRAWLMLPSQPLALIDANFFRI